MKSETVPFLARKGTPEAGLKGKERRETYEKGESMEREEGPRLEGFLQISKEG